MRKFAATLFELRMKIEKALQSIPFWPEIVRIAVLICAPVVRFANATLRAVPGLRKAEWLFEIELLTRRHPVPMAFSLCYLFWHGIQTTSLGHIGTDRMVYPLLAAISGFNPFLGILSGAAYGVGDLIQKLIWPDIYGARGWGDANYWGAIAGYILAYSSLMWMGVFPGAMSRLARLGARHLLRWIFARRVAAAADGAGPTDKYDFGEYYDPQSRTFHLNFKDPKVLQVVKGIMDDPRNLLADKDAWRNYPLTPEQKLVLAQMRGRGMLGDAGAFIRQPILDDAANLSAADTGPGIEPPEEIADVAWPPPGMTDTELLLEQLVAAAVAFAAADVSLHYVNPAAESVAFVGFRPHADYSCRHLENSLLAASGTPSGVAAGLGTLAPAVTGIGGPGGGGRGPGGGGPGTGPRSPQPDIASLVDRLNQLNPNIVYANPGLAAQVDAIRNRYEQTGQIDPTALAAVDGQLSQIDAQTETRRNQPVDWDPAVAAAAQQQQQAAQTAAAQQPNLVNQYNALVDRVIKGDLNSGQSLAILNEWQGRQGEGSLVNPDGSINADSLAQLQAALTESTRWQMQDQVRLNTGVAEAEGRVGTAWGVATTAAQVTRNTAFAVDGALAGGWAAAAAGGGVLGFGASTVVGTAYGAVTGGITAASDNYQGSWDGKTIKSIKTAMVDGAASGLVGSAAGGLLGLVTKLPLAGVNPYLSGALVGAWVGGNMSYMTGQNPLAGALFGGLGGAVTPWATSVAQSGVRQPIVNLSVESPWSASSAPQGGAGPSGSEPAAQPSSPDRSGTPSQPEQPASSPEAHPPSTPEGTATGGLPAADQATAQQWAGTQSLEELQAGEGYARAAGDKQGMADYAEAIRIKQAAAPGAASSQSPAQAEQSTEPPLNETRPTPRPAGIAPEELPQPGERPTTEEMDILKGYPQDRLLAGLQQARAAGDRQTTAILENALAEQGYRAPVDPSDIPPPDRLMHISELENLANKFSFDQLKEMAEQELKANGNTQTYQNLRLAYLEKVCPPGGYAEGGWARWAEAQTGARGAQAFQSAQSPPSMHTGNTETVATPGPATPAGEPTPPPDSFSWLKGENIGPGDKTLP
jgi:hypothetical protein